MMTTKEELNKPEFVQKLIEDDEKAWQVLSDAVCNGYKNEESALCSMISQSDKELLKRGGFDLREVVSEICMSLRKKNHDALVNKFNAEKGKFTSWVTTRIRRLLHTRRPLYNGDTNDRPHGFFPNASRRKMEDGFLRLDQPSKDDSTSKDDSRINSKDGMIDPSDGGEGAKLLYNHIDKIDPESEAMKQQDKMEKWLEYLNKEEFAKSWQNDPQKTLMLYLRVIGKLYCNECKRNKVQPRWRISTTYLKEFLGVHGEKAVIDNTVHRIREELEFRSCEHGYSFQKTR